MRDPAEQQIAKAEENARLAFGDDNSNHDTDCDCKACLIDTWHAEVAGLRREIEKLWDERARSIDVLAHITTAVELACGNRLTRLDSSLADVAVEARRALDQWETGR